MLRAVWGAFGVIFWTIFLGTSAILISYLGASQDFLNKIGVVWAKFLLWHCGVKVELEGLENLESIETCVFVANHQSHFDIPSIIANLPKQVRMVAKEELAKIPIFGTCIKRAGHITINRSNRREAIKSMRNAELRMKEEKICPYIFAEGTRSEDGTLLPFKKGAFVIATSTKAPIIPMAIWGSKDILPKGNLKIHSGKVRIRILKPILTEEMKEFTKEEIMNLTRNKIELALEEIKSNFSKKII
ncbi:MAG: 1-acyl-sn-glycerol-3-phosphate acyltransferase [Calditrichaeota bacterium]|nr:MAG: 1-acyl-sn-glycerol-3-phosphate acyltransferase [Calditrichota bacterium]